MSQCVVSQARASGSGSGMLVKKFLLIQIVAPSIVVLQATNPTIKHPLQQVLGGGQVPSDHVDLNATLLYERRQRTWRWQRDAWQDALLQDNLHACQVLLPACPGRQLPVLAQKGLY